jgi:hypothetical protein
MTDSDLELKYHDITDLYDLAEQLVGTVESEFVHNPEAQLALVEPLVEAVGASADVLTEEFLVVAGRSKQTNASRKRKVESAFRRLYAAIDEYRARVTSGAKTASKGLRNIADPIVERIKRQVEVVVSHFVDFIDISLDRIMQKAHLEELKQRQLKIASMLYHAGYGMEQG